MNKTNLFNLDAAIKIFENNHYTHRKFKKYTNRSGDEVRHFASSDIGNILMFASYFNRKYLRLGEWNNRYGDGLKPFCNVLSDLEENFRDSNRDSGLSNEEAEILSNHIIASELFILLNIYEAYRNNLEVATFADVYSTNEHIYKLFDSNNSNYLMVDNHNNVTLQERDFIDYCSENNLASITRLTNYDLDHLKTLYSDRDGLMIRFSKNLYYNTRTNKFYCIDGFCTRNYIVSAYLRANDNGAYHNRLFTKKSSDWFIRNFDALFPWLFEESDNPVINAIQKLIEIVKSYKVGNKFNIKKSEECSEIFQASDNLVSLLKEVSKQLLLAKKEEELREYLVLPDLPDASDKVLRKIKEEKQRLENQNRNSYLAYKTVCENYFCKDPDKSEEIDPEVAKAFKLLEKYTKENIIDQMFITDGNVLRIITKCLPMTFVDKSELKKTYKNTSYSFNNRDKLENHKSLISQMEHDSDLVFVTSPIVINIIFTQDAIKVGFIYNDGDADFIRNQHLKYGGNVNYEGTRYGTEGCRGSFVNSFSEACTKHQLARVISLIMQYICGFSPADIAGEATLRNVMIARFSTGEILSHRDDTRINLIGYNFRDIKEDFSTIGLEKVSRVDAIVEEDEIIDTILEEMEEIINEEAIENEETEEQEAVEEENNTFGEAVELPF